MLSAFILKNLNTGFQKNINVQKNRKTKEVIIKTK